MASRKLGSEVPEATPPSASSGQVSGNQQRHFLAPSVLCLRRLHSEARNLLPKQRTLPPKPPLYSLPLWVASSVSCHLGFLPSPGLPFDPWFTWLSVEQINTHSSPPPTRQRRFIHRSCCPADRYSGLLAMQPGMLLIPKVKGSIRHSHPPSGQLLPRIIQEL